MQPSAPRHAGMPPPAVITFVVTLALAALSSGAQAQSAGPGAAIELDPVVVVGEHDPAEARLLATPAAVSRIDRRDPVGDDVAPTAADALAATPGVVVQEFFGGNDQPRIQIRGSGLQQNPSERGLLILQDGMPVNRADGSYVVGLAAPGQAEAIEIFRGAAANRLNASVLGGAINFVSPSGASAPGAEIAIGGGSFGRRDLSARYGIDGETVDTLLRLEHTGQDGFRDINDSRRTTVGGNLSLRVGPARTRIFFSHTDLAFDVAGPLTWSALQANPRQNHTGPVVVGGVATNPGPNVVRDRPQRETTQTLAGVRTTLENGLDLIDAGVSLSRTDDSFAFPISASFRDTEGTDATLTARYARRGSTGELPRFETGISYSAGRADRDSVLNLDGRRGAAFGRNRLSADTLSIFAGANLPFGDFTLSPQLAWSHANRENRDRWSAATRPTAAYNPMNPSVLLPMGTVPATPTDYDRSYSGASPSIALSWKPRPGQLGWVSLARGFEAPTHDDLFGTINGTPNSSPGRPQPGNPALAAAMFATPALKAQRSDTLEIGWRGTGRGTGWDVVAYHSRLKNELLSLRDASGAALAAVNADRTRHTGLELGLQRALTDRLDGRLSTTWQDFRFHDDPLRGDNRIAGAPRQIIGLALDWRGTDRLTVSGLLRWVPSRTAVDNMNTVFNRSYTLVHAAVNYAVAPSFSVFARVANLFDERYAASTLVVDQANAQQAVYIPGEGRAITVGAKFRF